jgi:hypothetical protein
MPRTNGTGPQGNGPRTGRRLGRCGRPADQATAVADPYHDCGLGWGYWPGAGGRSRRSRGKGRGRGRGSARATREVEGSSSTDTTRGHQRTFLRQRIEALKEELNRVETLLSEYSSGELRE